MTFAGWRWAPGAAPLFEDRRDGGVRLAELLRDVPMTGTPVVLALPRGGVPVGAEVAHALKAPLDVLVVRKIGAPGREELALGAVASGGLRYLDQGLVDALGVSAETVENITRRERAELARREQSYRDERPFPELTGKTVVLVDDGVATGASMLVALAAVRDRHPAEIVVAAPVMSVEAAELLEAQADRVVSVARPDPFHGVGAWYGEFSQTTDEEVLGLLQGNDSTKVGAT